MLASARLGDDPVLVHRPRDQRLAECIVDLVGARVGQVFALEPDAGTAAAVAQPLRLIERGGTPHIIVQQRRQLRLPGRIHFQPSASLFQLMQWPDQCLGYKAPAIGAVIASRIGQAAPAVISAHGHADHTP